MLSTTRIALEACHNATYAEVILSGVVRYMARKFTCT